MTAGRWLLATGHGSQIMSGMCHKHAARGAPSIDCEKCQARQSDEVRQHWSRTQKRYGQ